MLCPGQIIPYHHHHQFIIIILYFHLKNQTRYSATTYSIIEMAGCQKSKCSSSWPPITTFTCIINIQTFIPTFTQTHSKPTIQTSKRSKYILLCVMQENFSSCRFTVAYPLTPSLYVKLVMATGICIGGTAQGVWGMKVTQWGPEAKPR